MKSQRIHPYRLTRDKFLTDDEVDELRVGLQSHSNKRDALLIELALATGARASELLAIKKSDLVLRDKAVYIRGLKGSDDRQIPIPPKLLARCLGLASKSSDLLFPISYRRLAQIWDFFKPNGKGFHSIRHWKGLSIYAKHRDIRLVKLLLGHRSIRNTEIYCDYHYSQTELRKLLVND